MVHRVQRVHKAILVPQDSQAQMAHQDLKDIQVAQEPLENPVRVDVQALWDKVVLLVQLDLQD